MKNQREIYEALLAGHKIKRFSWKQSFVFLNTEGHLVDEGNFATYSDFDNPEGWEIVKEPEIYEVECTWLKEFPNAPTYPSVRAGSVDFSSLVGKRTKLRIEVIE